MAELSTIVERVARRLGPLDGEPVPLAGGITNHNFRVRFGGRDTVLRLPGKETALLGISRDAERLAAERAAELGIAPALLDAGEDHLVCELIEGGPIDGARLRARPQSAARALRAFHDCGLQLPARFWVPDLLDRYAEIVAERGGHLSAAYAQARSLARRVADALPLSDPVACHDDLLPGNILARDREPDRAVLVDWEYAGMGHRMFDLGNLAVNNEFDEAAEDRLLGAYFEDGPDDGRRAALKLMRIMSDAREGAWGVIQGAVSELEFDFDGYASKHFARLTKAAQDPRLEEWLHGATA
ncbi:MAG TPA: phosphotransferase [Solirubrobacteraceae bacterium]|jgi:thiamine kinase-like enzyme